MSRNRYIRARWPDPDIPAGEPEWMLYELDDQADAVTRMVELFRGGTARRNSIEIEERTGRPCLSLVEGSLADGFGSAPISITREEFEQAWVRGVDTPFWNVR